MARWLRSERERAARSHPLDEVQRRRTWGLCSALLDYPTAELLDALAEDSLLAGLPDDVTGPVRQLIDHLSGDDLRAVQEDYVATFDHTRRCALYLTYFAFGDTRRRGVALVQFKQAYRKAGVEFDPDDESGELPDHLCAVLQFGAAVDHDAAWQLLLDHRAGVEMLRLALVDADSPWQHAMVALCATLPELEGADREAVRRLVQEGPPAEQVGLEPYMIDPQIPVGVPDDATGLVAGGTR